MNSLYKLRMGFNFYDLTHDRATPIKANAAHQAHGGLFACVAHEFAGHDDAGLWQNLHIERDDFLFAGV